MGLHPPKAVQAKLMPADTYPAICYAVYDLGTHYNDGKYSGDRHEIVIIFEIPSQRIEIEGISKPMAISKRYTLTLGQKGNLRKDLEAWRGKPFTDDEIDGFDLAKMMGKFALVQVIHKKKLDGTFCAVINSIMKLPKEIKINNKPENVLGFFSFEDEYSGIPGNAPQWVAELISGSKEYAELKKEQPPTPEEAPIISDGPSEEDEPEEDDLPF